MAIGIGIGIPFRRILNNTPALPTGLSASFTVDTISGDLSWTDNSGALVKEYVAQTIKNQVKRTLIGLRGIAQRR